MQQRGVAARCNEQEVAELARRAEAGAGARHMMRSRSRLDVRAGRGAGEPGAPHQRQVGPVVADDRDPAPFEAERAEQRFARRELVGRPIGRVGNAEVGDAVPRVNLETLVPEMLREMTRKGFGFTAVTRADASIAGIFTDGDLRRLIETGADLRGLSASEVMHPGPKLIRAEALAVEAAELMERHRVTGLIVVDAEGRLTGVLNSNDLMRAKVI